MGLYNYKKWRFLFVILTLFDLIAVLSVISPVHNIITITPNMTQNMLISSTVSETKKIVDIILPETLKMEHNEPTIIRGYLSCSQGVGYSCSSTGTRRITNVENLVITHMCIEAFKHAHVYSKWWKIYSCSIQ
jgi:hypothetical protein